MLKIVVLPGEPSSLGMGHCGWLHCVYPCHIPFKKSS